MATVTIDPRVSGRTADFVQTITACSSMAASSPRLPEKPFRSTIPQLAKSSRTFQRPKPKTSTAL